MASERQIEANRRNSALSTGPKTEAGKARSRVNATTHGLAAGLPAGGGEIDASPAFLDRRARWAAEQKPVGEAANWALDRAVAATFRIEDCERALDEVVASSRERAAYSWDEDRADEAAAIASGLARNPVQVSRRLRTSLAGVALLIEAWLGLIGPLGAGRDWSDDERSKALDLLGSDPGLRSGRTVVDPAPGEDPIPCRLGLAFGELERLEALRDEAMVPLDESDHRRAMKGSAAMLSRPAKLVMRYEREAWKQYREAMAQLRDPASAPEPPKVPEPVAQAPSPAPEPEVAEAPAVEQAPATRAESGRPEVTDRSQFAIEPVVVTDRSQFAGASDRVMLDLAGAVG